MKLMKLINLFPCKKAYYVTQDFFQKLFFENFAFYGLDTEQELEPKPEPAPEPEL
jgi:hypothetical protein